MPIGRNRKVAFLPALVCAALTIGCSCPKAVHTYEYLSDYGRMDDSYEPLVSLVYLSEDADLRDYDGLIVGTVGVGSELIESPEAAEACATYFRHVLAKEINGLERFSFVSLDCSTDVPPEALQGVLRLDAKITKFDLGSGFLRYVSFFMFFLQSSGATDLQIEGRIVEADSQRPVLEFADRRRDLGNTLFGPNPKTLRKRFAMNVTALKTAKCLARFIGNRCIEADAAESDRAQVASASE